MQNCIPSQIISGEIQTQSKWQLYDSLDDGLLHNSCIAWQLIYFHTQILHFIVISAPFTFLPSRPVVKSCDETGRWAGSAPGIYENPWGWTNYTNCFILKLEDLKLESSCDDNNREMQLNVHLTELYF
ncbi:unnamed protein product [Anisakis simplex]|uniref:Uncharacterized protein n=1 Tax=Anisakis simplex TaxID=6269 RepID=A0A3P6T5R6_ANISI|nr:unnamed protein product [Anisakis simplex]